MPTGNGKVISLNAITGEKNWSIQSIKNIATRGITLDINENERNFLFVPIGKSFQNPYRRENGQRIWRKRFYKSFH